MKLRVIVPTLGTSRWLDATLASIRFPQPTEIIVVSPMTTCGESSPADCRWLQEPSRGLYAALNAGLRLSGDWQAFTWINDDDQLTSEAAAAVAALRDDSSLGVVYGRVGLLDAQDADIGELPVAHRPADLHSLLSRGIVPFAQPGTMIRRELAESLGGFDEGFRLAGDLDFFVRALLAGARFAYVPRRVAEFRLHAGQLSKSEEAGDAEKGRVLARLTPNSPLRATTARWRFCWANRGVYLDRIRRHGFVSMRQLYRQP